MGLFGKKKKKKTDDFSDEEGGDQGDGDGPGGMPAFQGSDDNPYADDPAHKQLVKLLDSNGLVRHRRAFIRNSVYTVKHAKDCDAERLKAIGVFLEADRKKLLRIFKDVDPVESEVDKQREQEQMEKENEREEEEEMDEKPKKKKKDKKKDKKDKKDKKKDKKGKKKGKKKDKKKKGDDEEEDFDEMDLEEEESSKKKDKKKKGKKKKKKSKKEDKEDFEDFDELEEEPKEEKKSKKKKDKKKKGKKNKKKEKEVMDEIEEDFKDEFDEMDEIEEKPKKEKKEKKKKGKKNKDKEKEKVSFEPLEEEPLEEELYSPIEEEKIEQEEPKEKVEETRQEVVEDLDKEIKQSEKRMSHGSQALKMLNKKLGLDRRNSILSSSSRKSKQRRRSVATVDEDEEMWWKSLDKKDSSRRISFTDESLSEASVKKSDKKVQYLTEEEMNVLNDFRTQRKVTRRKRPNYFQQQPPPPPPMRQYNVHQTLQPPGEAYEPQTPYTAPLPRERDLDEQSTLDFSKYMYYKDKYNKRKKEKKRRKHEFKQRLKKERIKTQKKQKKKEYRDVRNDLFKDNPIWPLKEEGNFVSDDQITEQSSDGERKVYRYGNDDFFFNRHNNHIRVKSGGRGGKKTKNKINYFSSQVSDFESDRDRDRETILLKKRLKEIGALKYYPVLVKQGITCLKDCSMKKLESIQIPSRSRKRALINSLLEMKKRGRNKRDYYESTFEGYESDSEDLQVEQLKEKGLKSALKKSNLKRRRPREVSRAKTEANRHYFAPSKSSVSLAESDAEPDHVKVQTDNIETKSQDKKSVTFDLNDEDEISLPSFSEAEEGYDSEMTLESSD